MLKDILRMSGYTNIHGSSKPTEVRGLVEELHPDIIVLDLHMPELDGFGVMEEVKQIDEEQIYLPILVVSGDYAPEVKQRALSSGAKDFLNRPFDVIEIQLRIQNLLEARFLNLKLQEQNHGLEDAVYERTHELEQAHLDLKEAEIEVIARLARAGEYHDNDTAQHTQRVSLIASLIAQTLGLEAADVELLRRVAPLHDVGKIGVPDSILLKSEKLTTLEFETIQKHCHIGAQMLSGGQAKLVQMAEQIALTHHENWDGSGYPQGLSGEEIPLEARILTVADVFDALTHDRPYKDAWPVGAALEEIRALSGRKFDPKVVEAFLTLPHADLL